MRPTLRWPMILSTRVDVSASLPALHKLVEFYSPFVCPRFETLVVTGDRTSVQRLHRTSVVAVVRDVVLNQVLVEAVIVGRRDLDRVPHHPPVSILFTTRGRKTARVVVDTTGCCSRAHHRRVGFPAHQTSQDMRELSQYHGCAWSVYADIMLTYRFTTIASDRVVELTISRASRTGPSQLSDFGPI